MGLLIFLCLLIIFDIFDGMFFKLWGFNIVLVVFVIFMFCWVCIVNWLKVCWFIVLLELMGKMLLGFFVFLLCEKLFCKVFIVGVFKCGVLVVNCKVFVLVLCLFVFLCMYWLLCKFLVEDVVLFSSVEIFCKFDLGMFFLLGILLVVLCFWVGLMLGVLFFFSVRSVLLVNLFCGFILFVVCGLVCWKELVFFRMLLIFWFDFLLSLNFIKMIIGCFFLFCVFICVMFLMDGLLVGVGLCILWFVGEIGLDVDIFFFVLLFVVLVLVGVNVFWRLMWNLLSWFIIFGEVKININK